MLVNNAGIMPLAPFEEETTRRSIRQLELNLHAVIHGSKEAIRRMRPRGSGHIVNVASIAGKAGFPGGATYCAASTASSASARRSAPSCAAPASRSRA